MISGGLGLNILISAPYSMSGDWAAFSLCYSIIKCLPDAKIYLKRITNKLIDTQYFAWSSKLGISEYRKMTNPFILDCYSLMIRPLEVNAILACSEAKENRLTPLVSYKEGCGSFVFDEWINKDECPFHYDFMKHDICENEMNVLKLWKRMDTLYQFLGG